MTIVLTFWQMFLVLWIISFTAAFGALELKDWWTRKRAR